MLQNTGGRPVLRMHFPVKPPSGALPSNMVKALASVPGRPCGRHHPGDSDEATQSNE